MPEWVLLPIPLKSKACKLKARSSFGSFFKGLQHEKIVRASFFALVFVLSRLWQ